MKIELEVGLLRDAVALCEHPGPRLIDMGAAQDEGIFVASEGGDSTLALSQLAGNVTERGIVAVPLTTLKRLLAAMHADAVLEIRSGEEDEAVLAIDSGSWALRLPPDPLRHGMGAAEQTSMVQVDPSIIESLASVQQWASTDDSRPILCAVEFVHDAEEGIATATGTDGYALGTVRFACEGDQMESALIPAATVQWMSKLFAGVSELWLGTTGRFIEAAAQQDRWHIEMRARQTAGDFPQWKTLLKPTKGEHSTVSFSAAEMIGVLGRCIAMADDIEYPARLSIDEVLSISVIAQDIGNSTETIGVRWIEQRECPMGVAFSPRRLRSHVAAAAALQGDEVSMTLHSLKQCLTFCGDATFLTMPVRVS